MTLLFELVVFATLATLALVPLLRAVRGPTRRAPAIAVFVALSLTATAASAWWLLTPPPDPVDEIYLPEDRKHDGFVSSDTCRGCHPGNYQSWYRSYHRTMTQVARPENLAIPLADGERITLRGHGQTAVLAREGDDYWIDMVHPEWELAQHGQGVDLASIANPPRTRRRVPMTTGSHHFQVLWAVSERWGELWQVPWRYHIEEDRWVHRNDVFLQPPELGLAHGFRTWNVSCVHCHNTAGQPGLNDKTKMYDSTRVGELGIACESCHGPAAEHVRVNRDPRTRYRQHVAGGGDPSIVNPRTADPVVASEVCGQCHSHWAMGSKHSPDYEHTGVAYRPGDPLGEHIKVQKLSDGLRGGEFRFWSDGTCRSGGREYNGLLDSPCYVPQREDSMTCMSCHALHKSPDDPRSLDEWADDQLKPGMRGNLACTQCHGEYVEREALVRHTHHEPDSSGSNCYNCHMAHTSYALFKGIRSHQVDSPRVSSIHYNGRPNACNLCHLDRTLQWSAEHLTEWYEQPAVELAEDEREIAGSLLWLVRGDAGQRVVLAWHLGWEPARQVSDERWMAPFLADLLRDPYPAVRYVAWRSLKQLRGFEEFAYDADGPEAHRLDAVRRAVETWQRLPASPAEPHGAPLLMGPDRALEVGRFLALRQRRDDTPVQITE